MFTLHNGDCLQVLPSIPSGSIDAIITDLPYGTTECKWDYVIPFAPMWSEVFRVLKSNGVFITTASQPFSSAIVMSNPKLFRHEWIWIKNAGSNFANTVREPFKEHEQVLVFSSGKWTYNKQMQERAESGKSRVKTPVRHNTTQSENYREFSDRPPVQHEELRVPSSWQKFNRERGLHPTQKPVALYEYLIKTYTNEGETVLDIAMGSGTTIEAAERTGRNSIGIEKDKGIFETAVLRLNPFTPSNTACSGQGDSAAQSEFILP